MTRWKVTLEYEGSAFCGWQRQKQGLSVQQAVEEAIEKFSGEKVSSFVAGRTDAGVHAMGQVAHFDLLKDATGNKIRDAVNFHLRPLRVAVREAVAVDDTFHARFNALARYYRYRIVNRCAPPVLLSNLVWHIERHLEIEPMREAAAVLLGNHDFSTFRAQNCQAKSPVKTLDRFEVAREGEEIVFDVSAQSFLYHQVRNMVGTLVLVGTGRWSVQDFASAFQACDRTKGGPTAPPQGLCFVRVEYPKS